MTQACPLGNDRSHWRESGYDRAVQFTSSNRWSV